jgi:16S rRNA (adenine1518-N6/adenine1519-N6)-dimethyltransferase
MPGQTVTQIRRLLAAEDLAPQHRFGQNFLIDLNLMRKLVDAGGVVAGDTVLEVGAGTGSLTEILLDRGAEVVAVEIDHGLQRILRERLGGHPRFTLIQADALSGKHRVNPLVLKVLADHPPRSGGHLKLVANLPYQIATPLLMDLLYGEPVFERLTCTIQKEVGERLGAEPSTSAYGPVSVIVQSLAEIHPVAIIPPSAFWPRPQVESVMITLRPLPAAQVEVEHVPAFVSLVQRGFQQRRKMIKRLFRDRDELEVMTIFARSGVSPEARPEALSPEDWRRLQRVLS